jgi:hypothetical protein
MTPPQMNEFKKFCESLPRQSIHITFNNNLMLILKVWCLNFKRSTLNVQPISQYGKLTLRKIVKSS